MENEVQYKDAVNFLLYSYFNIEPKHSWKDIVRAAIIKAYNDATMQGAYNTLFRKDMPQRDKLLNESKEARSKAGFKLEEELQDLFASGSHDSNYYNGWHSDLCDKIRACFEKVKTEESECFFTYGNAQKWVNMTVKYIYILDALLPDKSEYREGIKKYAGEFHVPVDSYIIEAVWDSEVPLPLKDGANRKKKYKHPADYVKAWSSWGEADYKDFSEKIRTSKLIENDSPITWEGTAWIEQSVKRKGKTWEDHIKDFFKPDNV